MLNTCQTHARRQGNTVACGHKCTHNTLVSLYCTETRGIAGCDTVSAVVAFALTGEPSASSFSKVLLLPYLWRGSAVSHIRMRHELVPSTYERSTCNTAEPQQHAQQHAQQQHNVVDLQVFQVIHVTVHTSFKRCYVVSP